MIRSLKVNRLNSRVDADLNFNEDLNIITGRNGSGKTTLLKLIWYLISGNLERVVNEVDIQSVSIKTDKFFLSLDLFNSETCKLKCKFINESKEELKLKMPFGNNESSEINFLKDRIARAMKSSLFFPTFRRIEGGFGEHSASKKDSITSLLGWGSLLSRHHNTENFRREFSTFFRNLSVYDHKFIVSISTHDIVELLKDKYTEISEKTNELHVNLSKEITRTISETKKNKDAISVLDHIQSRVQEVTNERNLLLRPFSVLSELSRKFFEYEGIRVSDAITLGEARAAIESEKLSAGEKHMLSFLCYNTFSKKTAIFIDEPELSLHVDWQRLLLPTLLKQGTGNQFFIATHSPFIYAKYPEKEFLLGEDRGDK